MFLLKIIQIFISFIYLLTYILTYIYVVVVNEFSSKVSNIQSFYFSIALNLGTVSLYESYMNITTQSEVLTPGTVQP